MVIEFVASQAYFLFAKPTIVEVNMFGVWALVGTVVTASLLLQLITSYSFKSAEFQYSMLSFMLFAAIALVSAGPADALLLDFNLASCNSFFFFFFFCEFITNASVMAAFVTFRELVLTSLESNNMSDLKYVVNRLTESNTTLIWVVLAAFLGSITVYPAIRFGVLYAESADEHKDSLSKSLLLHASFVLPIIAPLLWVLPITRKFDLSFQYFFFSPKRNKTLLNHFYFILRFLTWLRVAACLIVVLSRFAVVRTVVQTYLDSVGSTIKKISGEEGRLTLFDFRLKIWPIVFYVCVVTLQLVGPVLLLLYATLLMASWGDIGFYHSNTPGIVFSGQMLLPVFSFFTWFLVTVQALGSTLAVLSQRLGQQFR